MTGRGDGDSDVRRDDALRARLAGIDPARPGGPAFAADPTPEDVRERVMAITRNDDNSTDDLPGGHRHRPAWGRWVAAAAAAVVLVAAGITGALTLGADDPATTIPPTAVAPTASASTALALTLPADNVISSCASFRVRRLARMPVAFAGTVTSVTDGEEPYFEREVTLDVDRWYQGSAAQQRADIVTLSVPGLNVSTWFDGVEFTEGESYLLTATDGTVNGCGFSGPATPELEAAYAEAFGE